MPRLSELLADDERERVARFRFDHLRRRFVVAHGFVRSILAGYVERQAHALVFDVSDLGKPRLRDSDLQFNLSHSHEMAVMAIARHRVGIDIEHIRRIADAEQIAERYFAPEEIEELRRAGADGFFRCWTRKEAFIKAHGKGFSMPLRSFSVSVAGAARLLRADDDPARWTLADVEIVPGYVCAIAVEGGFERLVVREWDSG